MMKTKTMLRQEALFRRQSLTPEEVKCLGLQVIEKLIQQVDWKNYRVAHIYLSCDKRKEINTRSLFEYLWREQPHILTVTNRHNVDLNQIDCYRVAAETALEQNQFGIFEPSSDAEKIDPKKIELMVIPLLISDHQGYRVGYGKGYYDQLLSRCSSKMRRIGVNYFPPLTELLPREPHDLPLDELVLPF